MQSISIKQSALILGTAIFIIISLMVMMTLDLWKNSKQLKLIEQNRYLMFEKSDELRQSSDDLTRFARQYVITGNPIDYQTYFKILDIRNGKAKRPKNYSDTYWAISEPVRSQRHPSLKSESLKSGMEKLPFLPSELALLEKSESNSNALVAIELEAFNTMQGILKDRSGNYTIKGKPDQSKAIKLLFSKQYSVAKEEIMLPIDEFLHRLSQRTSSEIDSQNKIIRTKFKRIFLLLLVSIVTLMFAGYIIRRKILTPIADLTKEMSTFEGGVSVSQSPIEQNHGGDEISNMTIKFYAMKNTIDDDLKRLEFALNAGQQGWFDLNPITGESFVSDEYAKLLGFDPATFSTDFKNWKENIHPDDLQTALEGLITCMKIDKPLHVEYRRKNSDGHWIWLHSVSEVVERNTQGEATRIIGVNADISKRKQHEFQEQIRSKVLEQLVQSEPLVEILNSIIQVIQQANPNMLCSVLLLDKSEKHLLMGAAPSLPDYFNQAVDGIEIGMGVGSCGTAAFTGKRVIVEDINSHPFWQTYQDLTTRAKLGSCWSDPIRGTNDRLLGTFAIYQNNPSSPSDSDITLINFVSNLVAIAIEKTQVSEKISLLARVYSDSHEGIFITDSNGSIIDINPAFTAITGFTNEEANGMNLRTLGSGSQPPEFFNELWKSLNRDGYWQGEIWNQRNNGERYAELLSITSLQDEQDNIINFVGFFSDITESKKQQEKLDLMAHYDVLTQLPNRVLFADRFNHAIAQSHRSKSQLAICFLDLDNFKPINDNFGHKVGDLILVEVASRITRSIREEDTVSRQGGDEFTLLLGNIDSAKQCELTIQRILLALAKPYVILNHTHQITASIGITLYPLDQGDIDTLLRHADQAMYHAKLSGKNKHHFFNADKDQRAIVKHRQLNEVEKALSNNQLELYYQPKVDMLNGEIFGAEALIRWNHPKIGIIPPNDFLPIVESSKLEISLGYWVIDQALIQLSEWLKIGLSIEVSVNISSRHLQSPHFIEQLRELLTKHNKVNPNNLQLEILESSALSDLEAISQVINTCRTTLGVNVALDDFGTGYSSLTHLRNLSANTVKIDRIFVRDMLDDPGDYAIIEGVIGLAASFDREIIAEGVEQVEHGLMLMLMGCNKAQGFGIAKPMRAIELPDWITSYQPNQRWIECGRKILKQQDRKLAVFKLTTHQWKNKFVDNIFSESNQITDWPILNKNNCPCGTWIKRAKQEQFFDINWLAELDNIHKELHLVANELYDRYQEGHLEKVRGRVDQLLQGFNTMSKLIKQQGTTPKLFD